MAEFISIDKASLDTQIHRTKAKLKALSVKVQKKVLRKAVRAANAPAVKVLRKNVPRGKTKQLARTIGQQVRTNKDGSVTGVIGQNRAAAKKRNAVHIHLVENRTQAHAITGTFRNSAGALIQGTFNHPGTQGQEPVSMTQQQTEKRSLAAFVNKAAEEVDKEAAAIGGLP